MRLEARLQRLIAGNGDEAQALPGCAWALIRNRRISDSGAVGFADPLQRRRLRATSPMRVASISKLTTTLLAMQQVDAGRITLDDDVSDALGFALRNPAFPETPITLRLLLSHTSTMRDGEVYWAGLGERIADFFTPDASHWENGGHWSSEHPPGAYFKYCNLAFGVIATIVERLEGERFDLVAHERILHPLGLDAGFNWSGSEDSYVARGAPLWQRAGDTWEAQLDDPLPVGRGGIFLNPNNLSLADYRLGDNGPLFSPQGGLRASARDLARIGCLLLGPGAPFVSPASLQAMRTLSWRYDGANGDAEGGIWRGYGLGMQIVEPGEGSPIANLQRPLVGHSGDAYALRGGLWLDVERGAGFVFLFNGGPDEATRARGQSGFLRSEEIAMQALHEAVLG